MKMKKFFAKHLCFCCSFGICDQENKKTAVPSKQPVELHNIVAKTNGNDLNHMKQTYINSAYKAEDKIVSTQQPLKESNENHRKSRQVRQLSDLSEMFRLPLPDEKSLSDLVIEEYDFKSRTLHARELGNLSDHRTSSSRFSSCSRNSSSSEDPSKKDQSDDKPVEDVFQSSEAGPSEQDRKIDQETSNFGHQ